MGVSRGVSSERAQRASRNGGPRGYDDVCWVLGEAGGCEIIGYDNFGARYFANDKFTISLHGQRNDILSATCARA